MSEKPIVAATDGSGESLRAVEWAAREAVLRKAPLRIVSAAALLPRMVGSHGMSQYDTVADLMRQHRDQALAAAAVQATREAPGLLIDTDELTGEPAQAVIEAGSGAQLLVLGSRGVGAFTALLLGSVSRYAATHASCPVVVVRDETRAEYRQVGVGLGDLDHCAEALTFAFEEAALRRATVVAIHAWHVPQPEVSRAGSTEPLSGDYPWTGLAADQLRALLESWQAKYPGVPVSQEVVHGHPGRALVGLSARADLTVLGRHARHPGLLGPGTVTHAVLNHAHGPVVTVPSSC
jgi:nucleotide-binding universal stress UspA family protein